MSIKGVREAFNEVASPTATASLALLDYQRAGGVEWQVLVFSGTYADGSGFSIKSDQIRPLGDIYVMARETAAKLLATKGAQA